MRELSYKDRLILKIIGVVLFAIFAVTTFLGMESVYNVVSPFLSFSMALLIFFSMSTTGKYYRVAVCFLLGVSVWFLGDIFWAVTSFMNQENEILSSVNDNFYLVSDYIFLLGAIVYARDVFKKSDYHKIAVNAFIIAVITSIIGYSFGIHFYKTSGFSIEIIELLFYSFVSVFSIVTEAMVISKTGLKNHNKAFYIICLALFFFYVMEIRYSVLMMQDIDPENVYIDILYMFCLLMYSFGWSVPTIMDKVIVPKEKVNKYEKYVPWFNATLILAIAVFLYRIKYFDAYMLLGMIIANLGYLIMCITVQANALSEELLARQKDETARLERMVAEKIKELQKVNDHLEYISNTDVLTGLYNRRYGMDYLENIVKDGANYPIALYSLDLNHFKPINDNYGHDMGDVVLKEVGRRLANLGQERCTAVRIGGDEFLVVFRNATNEIAVRGVADLLCKAMDEPIEASVNTENGEKVNHTFEISASIGIAGIPGDATSIEELYKMADDALYTVKHTSEKSSYLMYRDMEEFKKSL